MPRIHRLPDAVVNQIAAGEVVERPASVVKELVENALDAGSRAVNVRLEDGGRSLVVVEDDGCGIAPEDAPVAVERHATSKITTAEDLSDIATLGFRGEALPSIAAASRLRLETAAADGEGTLVDVDFGRLVTVEPCARARGTTITVRDLFARLPARRKFLRTDSTELRHATATLSALAFAHPRVAFTLAHGPRPLLRLPAAADRAGRLADLVGPTRARAARPVRHGSGQLTVDGFLIPGGRDVVLVVNGRVVRDRLLVGAVNRALRDAGGGSEAEAFLVLTLPSAEVDVNVHPTKAEVRFAEPGRVFAAIAAALAQARLALHAPAPVRRIFTVGGPPAPARLPLSPPPPRAAVAEQAARWTEQTHAADRAPAPSGRYLGQYRSTYLLLEDDDGLLLVDQHAAHERVLFEELLAADDAPAVQRLLIPAVVELPAPLALLVEEHATALTGLGLEVEPASGGAVRVLAVPATLGAPAAGPLLEAVLADLAAGALPGETIRQRLAAGLACRAAIKKHWSLAAAEAERLLERLALAGDPHRCPHGRPTALRLAHEEIERRIGRR